MVQQRKTAEHREKDLKLAIYRIERGRAHSKATKLSIAAVAREAEVTPALIHNHYPLIANEIRMKLGASSRQQRDAKHDELKRERERNKALRGELAEMRTQVSSLATINEMLHLEIRSLKAQLMDTTVVSFTSKRPEKS